MQAFIILTNGDIDKAYAMEMILNEMFRNMNIAGTAHAYYEDWDIDDAVENSDEIEYGVRVDVDGLSREMWQGFLEAMSQPWEHYGTVVVKEA